MNTVDTAELRARLASGERIWLVHAAERPPFKSAHLPGAVAFADADRAAAFVRNDDRVVVYGADGGCRASRALVAELVRRGCTDVAWYAEGLEGWLASGGPVEGSGESPLSRR